MAKRAVRPEILVYRILADEEVIQRRKKTDSGDKKEDSSE